MKSEKPRKRPDDFEPETSVPMIKAPDTSSGPVTTQTPPPPTSYEPPEISAESAATGR